VFGVDQGLVDRWNERERDTTVLKSGQGDNREMLLTMKLTTD